jgi:hypothetical protein
MLMLLVPGSWPGRVFGALMGREMGSATDSVGLGSATQSESDRRSLVADGTNVADEILLPTASEDGAGDETSTESTEPAADQGTDGSAPNRQDDSSISTIWVVLFWACIGAFIALSNRTSRTFIFHWWWAILLPTIVIGTLLGIPAGQRWLKAQKPSFRAGLFIFVVIPLLLALVGSVTVLPQRYQVIALRSVTLVTVCLLPAVMWFLFIATRKASLLNGFVANLHRLGLLAPTPRSSSATPAADPAHDQRLMSYMQKFESVYGALPQSVRDKVLKKGISPYEASDVTSPIAQSTATIPVMLSTILIALGWLVTLPPAQAPLAVTNAAGWAHALEPTATPVTLAFLGAYFFSLQMLFRRYIRSDLGGSAYVAVSMRIVLAVIGTWVVMVAGLQLGLATQGQLLVIGFVIGVFPQVAWQIIQAAFRKATNLTRVKSMESDLPLSDLDGLTVWHEARLEEEDIENIPNMATADLVELFINTRFPADRIIDWVDQAILYTQLGASNQEFRGKLRLHGIRTATCFLEASAASKEQKDKQAMGNICSDNAIEFDPSLEVALLTNSNLALVRRWRKGSPVEPCPLAQSKMEHAA